MQQNLSVFGKTYRNLTTVSFSMAAVHLQSLYRIFHLKLIPVDHLLPLLYYFIRYVDIRVLKSFLLSKSSVFEKKRSNCFLTSTISRHWAQQGWHLLLLLLWSAILSLTDQFQFISVCPLPGQDSVAGRWSSCTVGSQLECSDTKEVLFFGWHFKFREKKILFTCNSSGDCVLIDGLDYSWFQNNCAHTFKRLHAVSLEVV